MLRPSELGRLFLTPLNPSAALLSPSSHVQFMCAAFNRHLRLAQRYTRYPT